MSVSNSELDNFPSFCFFNKRLYSEIKNSPNNARDLGSVGYRIAFALNSWDLIKENPLIGVGTGDFPNEYMRINEQYTPNLKTAVNPHNMYALISVQLGLVGLISMLSIFYFQIKASFHEKNNLYRDLGLALPLSFLVIMLSDSYILGHFTTLLYVFFSAFLYQKFE